jgi:flagellar basal body-associated protein FliL
MAALLIQTTLNVTNGGTRILLLILLILAVLLILAGALIAMFTFYYAYRHREDKNTAN